MASGLQCPSCAHVHSVDEVGEADRFRCRGCDKLLAVPAVPAQVAAPGPGAGQAREATAAVPQVDRPPASPLPPPHAPVRGRSRPPAAKPLPAPLRVLVWLLALPIGFVAAAVPLRAVGLLDLDDAIDAFASTGFGRFAVLLVLLPLWAAVTAGLAHVVLEFATRRRNGRRPPAA